MEVNIITERYDWILKRAAQELAVLKTFRISQEERRADYDYFLPYTLWRPKEKHSKTKQVVFLTHIEEAVDTNTKKKKTLFSQAYASCDAAIFISKNTANIAEKFFPKVEKPHTIIHLGSQFKKKIIFGVCGKVHPSGRKNEHWISELQKQGFHFKAWGEGWPVQDQTNKLSDLAQFYASIDYLIVSSKIEGGPVPVLEAVSLGVPVIAPDIGWCWEYPCLYYAKDNFNSLLQVMTKLTNAPTWDDWRTKHLQFFEGLK